MEEAQERFSQDSAVERFWPHYELGWIDMTEDTVEAARQHFRCGLAVIEDEPGCEVLEMHVRGGLALAEAASGHAAEGLAHAMNAVDTARWLEMPGLLVMALIRSAETAAVAGAPAGPDLLEALSLIRDHASRRWVAEALTLAALSHENQGSAEVAARLLGGAAAVADSMGEKPQALPVMARLANATEARLAAALGVEVLAEYEAAGRSTSVPGLLQIALGGRRSGRDR
jgi:hypothetical protein